LNLTDKERAPMRLQTYLAHCGVASRRASEGLISSGRVAVNGVTVTQLGTKVLPGDTVALDGRFVQLEQVLRYLALHKPPGYLCSAFDPQGRPLAQDLLPRELTERLYTIGRLDFRSSGLILFTNDGAFAARLAHPSAEVEKEYLVESTGPIPDQVLQEFSAGMEIEGVRYQCSDIERLGRKALRVVLIEGKNREIRRVFSHFHLHPQRLHRIRIGPVRLGTLEEGKSRPLTEREMELLPRGTIKHEGAPHGNRH